MSLISATRIKEQERSDGREFSDSTDALRNDGYRLQFYHLPSQRTVTFKAFVTEFSDSISVNASKEDVYGRMDGIRRYASTGRSISLAFEIPAYDKTEAAKNIENVSLLAQMQYPSFDTVDAYATTINAPPLIRVKYGNMITKPGFTTLSARAGGLLCFTEGLTINPDIEVGTFPLENGAQMFKLWRISMTLDVIHENALGWTDRKLRGKDRNGRRTGFVGFPYNVQTVGGAPSTSTVPDDLSPEAEQFIEPPLPPDFRNISRSLSGGVGGGNYLLP